MSRNPSEAIQILGQILSNSGSTKVVVGRLFRDIEIELDRFFEKSDFPTFSSIRNGSSKAHQVSEADVGISSVEFAIASTGTVVEVTTDDSDRLISSLPEVHIAFLRASQIVNTLEEAAVRLRALYQQYESNCNITFISGPSRTADIEMKLFLGVHGPQKSNVIVCDW